VSSVKDFFISYNKADRDWAEWIAWTLEEAGYSVVIQAWDFRPGGNFVLEMHKAAARTEKTIPVLSEDYLTAEFTHPEWAAAFARDPQGKQRTLVPVRARTCEPEGLLGQTIYVDLVGRAEADARSALLGAFAERAKPGHAPAFPGGRGEGRPAYDRVAPVPVQYPGVVKKAGEKLWNVPYSRNTFFTGREKVLNDLRKTLQSTQAAALTGLPGVGKTQTAVEYAYRQRKDYQSVFWAKAESRETLISDLASIATLLDLPESKAKEQEVALGAVKRWLENSREWLLVLDNADELRMVRDFLPGDAKGHVLLTTRARSVGAIAQRVEIDEMEPKEGALFLLRRAGVIAKDAQLDAASQRDRELAMQISRELGGLPLALDQAGAFIEETPSTLAEYVELYKTEGAKLRAERGASASTPLSP
jgi:hypothetical protein